MSYVLEIHATFEIYNQAQEDAIVSEIAALDPETLDAESPYRPAQQAFWS